MNVYMRVRLHKCSQFLYLCMYLRARMCLCVCVCAYGTLVRSYVYTYFGRYTYVGLKNRRPNEQILQVQLYRC